VFFFVSLWFFRYIVLISRSFSLQNFSWSSNFSVLFRFASIFPLHFAYFAFDFASDFCCFASTWNKWNHAFFSLPSETKLSLQFQFSLPQRKRGRTLGVRYRNQTKKFASPVYKPVENVIQPFSSPFLCLWRIQHTYVLELFVQ